MTRFKSTLFTAIFIATAFTLSCSSDDGGDNSLVVDGGALVYGSQSYRTVIIGGQRWMAENLNYTTPNTTTDSSWCFQNNLNNCANHGRLYNWNAAMSACPAGWRLPDTTDWNLLLLAVGGSGSSRWPQGGVQVISSDGTGKKLKSKTGWNNNDGTDDYGFSALPGGYRFGGTGTHYVSVVNSEGYWWSATARSGTGSDSAYNTKIAGGTDAMTKNRSIKRNGYSVRCVQWYGQNSISSSSTPSSSSSSSIPLSYGTLTYQGQSYKTIKIGTQTWMAENLNYNVSGSVCYDGVAANCTTYGRMYLWVAAMALPASCNLSSCAAQITQNHRGICPAGWHVSNDADWTTLMNYVGNNAGTKLKSASWGGTNDYGFSALPGGESNSMGSDRFTSFDIDKKGNWWSSTSLDSDTWVSNWALYNDNSYLNGIMVKSVMLSVRCVQN